MTEETNRIPDEIQKIAALLTVLELAFIGKPNDAHDVRDVRYDIKPTSQAKMYDLINFNPGLLSLDWIEEQYGARNLPITRDVFSTAPNKFHIFRVCAEYLPAIESSLNTKIASLWEEHSQITKQQFREAISSEFRQAAWDRAEKESLFAISPDVRTPDELTKEAAVAYLWTHPEDIEQSPGAKGFFNDLSLALDKIDHDKIFNEEERSELVVKTGEQFIAIRRLERTLDKMSDRLPEIASQLKLSL